jgi:arylsulfatase A-like enzyme
VAILIVSVACGRAAPSGPVTIRLVDLFKPEVLQGTEQTASTSRPTEWRFDGEPTQAHGKFGATRGAEASPSVQGLSVKDGRLVGRSTSDFPIVRVERTADLDNADQVHAIEIRLTVSAGANISVVTRGPGPVNFVEAERAGRNNPFSITSPLVPGSAPQTYTLTSPIPLPMARARQLLIRPTDVAGADFEIESVRLITRREHLASVPSGIGWQGLGEIYRETIVSRAGETMTFDVDLPERPWLDLSIGTTDDHPATFKVAAAEGTSGEAKVLFERTVTTPYRWQRQPVDLAGLGGKAARLTLSVSAEQPGALGFWGAPVVRARSTEATDRPRGVILIHADTLRPDHLSFFGHKRETAPFLGRMASEGVLFKRAVAQAAWTKVSTSSFMTSLYPTTHGVAKFVDRIPASATTIAEVYRSAGYATLGTSSVPFTGQNTNLHQGFEELHELPSVPDSVGPFSSKTAREYVDRTAEWIELHRDSPFFVYLHVFDPHSPYEPRRPYDSLWADPARRDAHVAERDALRKFITTPFLAPMGMATREEMLKANIDPEAYLAYDKDWYDSSIKGLDNEIARLVERLRSAGLERDTAIVFLSDHGEEFHDHGRMWHGQSVYGEMMHVPLFVWWPGGIAKGVQVDEPVQLIDVMPTLLDLSKLEHPEGIQGQSLAPFLKAGGDPSGENGSALPPGWRRRPVVMEKVPMDGMDFPDAALSHAISDGEWKLIHNRVKPPEKPEFELFDARKDPLDQKNLAAEHPEIVERLGKALEGWRGMAEAARLKPDAETNKSMSPEQLQRLRSLGYVK